MCSSETQLSNHMFGFVRNVLLKKIQLSCHIRAVCSAASRSSAITNLTLVPGLYLTRIVRFHWNTESGKELRRELDPVSTYSEGFRIATENESKYWNRSLSCAPVSEWKACAAPNYIYGGEPMRQAHGEPLRSKRGYPTYTEANQCVRHMINRFA
jgi:hypothetical protein